jgi:hypothetical protein
MKFPISAGVSGSIFASGLLGLAAIVLSTIYVVGHGAAGWALAAVSASSAAGTVCVGLAGYIRSRTVLVVTDTRVQLETLGRARWRLDFPDIHSVRFQASMYRGATTTVLVIEARRGLARSFCVESLLGGRMEGLEGLLSELRRRGVYVIGIP